MSRSVDQIATAVGAVELHPPLGFTWLDRPSIRPPAQVARAMSAQDARRFLLAALARRLYTDFFASGGVRPASPEHDGGRPDPAFVGALVEGNRGVGPWEPGWRITGVEPDGMLVERDAFTILAPATACRPVRAADRLEAGTDIELHLPNALPGRSAGYYMALGDLSWTGSATARGIRLYWHLAPEGAAPFVRLATQRLNAALIPFRLKVLDNPASFQRCDAAVLYLPDMMEPAGSVVRELRGAVRACSRDDVPALTLPLAPGVAAADDPADGGSFGMHRCRLIAEGSVMAHEKGLRSLEHRLRTVLDVLRDAGIDPERPYLSPGSTSRLVAQVEHVRERAR